MDVVETIRRYAEADNIDYATYQQMQYFVSDTVSLILGIVFTFVCMTFSLLVALDVIYLTNPLFRDVISRKGLDGSLNESKLKIISAQARKAVVEADTLRTGESPIGIYLRSRLTLWIQFIAMLLIFLSCYSSLVRFIGIHTVEIYLKFKDKSISTSETVKQNIENNYDISQQNDTSYWGTGSEATTEDK